MERGNRIPIDASHLGDSPCLVYRNNDGSRTIQPFADDGLKTGLYVRQDGTCYYNGTLLSNTAGSLPFCRQLLIAALTKFGAGPRE